MKISAVCLDCDRRFLAGQALESGGRCPWCGTAFQSDYAAVLVDALRDAEEAGSVLEAALEKLAQMKPRFRLDADPIIDGLRTRLEQLSG